MTDPNQFLFCFYFFTGSVVLKKIKYNTNLEHEFIQNFKFLQSSFTKLGVDKVGGNVVTDSVSRSVPLEILVLSFYFLDEWSIWLGTSAPYLHCNFLPFKFIMSFEDQNL